MVDAAASTFTSCKHHTIVLKLLNVAFLPRVLMFADDDGWAVAPQEKNRVDHIEMLKNVLLCSQVEKNIV